MSSSNEIVAIVDKHDRVSGSASRSEMRRLRLIHRASYILVFNAKGELFVQKRTMNKDIYPGYWDIAAGGVVLAGESYEESAARELLEELGITTEQLTHIFDQYYEDDDNRVWGRIFSCRHDGPFTLQEEEVAGGKFMKINDIQELANNEPVTPDSIRILNRLATESDSHAT